MKVGAQQLGDKVTGPISMLCNSGDLRAYMSSSGEMKMSLRLMICAGQDWSWE